MDLRQFDCFLAVAETLHFGRAADALHMSQSSVSEAIKALERTLGGPLFERSSRRVALTPLGETLNGARVPPSSCSRAPSTIASARHPASRAICASASWAAVSMSCIGRWCPNSRRPTPASSWSSWS